MFAPLNPNSFSHCPLNRVSAERERAGFVDGCKNQDAARFFALWKGQPLLKDGEPGAQANAISVSRKDVAKQMGDAPTVLLGLWNEAPIFALDVSNSAEAPESAAFSNLGSYQNLRDCAAKLAPDMLSVLGHGKWLLDWHNRHRFCANCGAPSEMRAGGARRHCDACGAGHYPRTDAVAIVLAEHEGACLLGRNPEFPEGFYSTLAGFVEPAETPEQAAHRELFEEAGLKIDNITYQFSQPWPFPSSLMMGFFATANSRELVLDPAEIVDAKWLTRDEIIAHLNGDVFEGMFIPPRFTIARRLIERWANRTDRP